MLLIVLVSAAAASASHFRYGSNSWKPGSGPTDVDLQVAEAWRRSAFSGSGGDGFAMPGDVIASHSSIDFGDGTFTGFDLLVTSVDVTNDWLYGIGLDPNRPPGDTTDTLIGHTYPSPGNYVMSTDGCCRVGQTSINWHVNNPDDSQRVETLVNVGGTNRSPVSTLPPIVQCPINGLCSFTIPTSDPDGDPLHFRFSTPTEAGSASFNQPGPPEASNAASINPTTGLYTWDTTGATLGPAGANTLYSTQVTIEDLDGAGAVKSKIAVDFLIQLVASVGSPPVFVQPPTPVCGSTVNTGVGSNVTFTVQASDADAGDTVTLNVAGLPSGATMTPALPTSGSPVSSGFSWTPTASQTGSHVITFSATDSSGQQALCGITINVTAAPLAADLSITKDDAPDPVVAGNALTYTLTVSNAGPDPATGVSVTDTLAAGVTFGSATPSQGSCTQAAGTVTCNLGTLPSGGTATVVIQTTAPATTGTISNTASVSANESDPRSANNSDTEGTTVAPGNRAPDCSAVTVNPNSLWPPNHTLQLVRLGGATDPDGDPVTITITGVTQDEPLNGLGDGDTSPDARVGSASNEVLLRAERGGGGDGRVYRIAFTATDPAGASCTGVVKVGVPHSQGPKGGPVDSGLVVNSFGP